MDRQANVTLPTHLAPHARAATAGLKEATGRGKDPTRILLVETGSGHGGSAKSLRNLVKHLDPSRFAPDVIFYSANPWGLPRVKELGASVTQIIPREVGKRWFDAALGWDRRNLKAHLGFLLFLLCEALPRSILFLSLLRERRIALVHLNNQIISSVPIILAARLRRVPIVCHVRGSRRLTWTERRFAPLVDYFIPVSETAARYCRDSGIALHRMEVVYNGVEAAEYERAMGERLRVRKELGIPPDAPLIGTVARIARVKGQMEFLYAAREVQREFPQARFIVVGDTIPEEREYERSLWDFVSENGLKDRVIFTGWRNDVPELTAALDIAVQASFYREGLPNAVMEAMILGKAVVVTDAGALGETVGDEGAGIVIPTGDVRALVKELVGLLRDPDRARELGRRARRRAERMFRVDVTVDKIQRIYGCLLDGGRQAKNAPRRH